MAKPEYQFDDFLAVVAGNQKKFATKVHNSLVKDGYKVKVESKASGMFASYSHPKTKRSMLNFLFRKTNLVVRIYADNIGGYSDLLSRLPEEMVKVIDKAPVCKRMINPEDCNPRCIMGYDFHIQDNHYQKCRYSCFQFDANPESLPVLAEFIENERQGREMPA